MKCCRCHLEIGEGYEKYVSVTDFDGGKKGNEVFLHLACWKTMFKDGITDALRKKVNQVMNMIKQ